MEPASRIRLILWKAAKAIEKVDCASIAETGLQLSEFAIMEVLLHKGALPIKVIGEKVLLTSGSMTAAVNRLQKKGFVKRVPDDRDGRSFYIHLTDDGRKVIKQAFEKHAKNLEMITSDLKADERQMLIRLLKRIGTKAEKILSHC
jgi:MarR family transcriptional regulator, 2-MHQ and catechol-resistance regulon repressor